MSTNRLNRRQFLKRSAGAATAAVGFPYVVPSSVLGGNGAVAPSERITVGCIGVGNMGTGDMGMMLGLPDVQVVAVCDPYKSKREAARKIVNDHYKQDGCAAYNDFRELVARQDIDVVTVATTDHWHVPIALAAVRSGKDVYVEKPLGLTIGEDQALRAAAVAWAALPVRYATTLHAAVPPGRRVGTERTARQAAHGQGLRAVGFRRTHERTDVGARARARRLRLRAVAGSRPVGTVHAQTLPRPHWFHNNDYSIGYIGGWGIHHMDSAQWGMDELGGPVEIEASGVFPPTTACATILSTGTPR
jgi:predicted dehydrogenase